MKSFEGLKLLIFIGGWENFDENLGNILMVVRTSLTHIYISKKRNMYIASVL